MALVVITLQDEGDGDEATVDCKFLFEPMVKDGESSGAQIMAARMLQAVSDSVSENEEEQK